MDNKLVSFPKKLIVAVHHRRRSPVGTTRGSRFPTFQQHFYLFIYWYVYDFKSKERLVTGRLVVSSRAAYHFVHGRLFFVFALLLVGTSRHLCESHTMNWK